MTNRDVSNRNCWSVVAGGKELSEELGASSLAASDVVLLDEEDAAGQVTAAADEVSFIQRLEASSFERMDFVFFAGGDCGDEEALAGWRGGRAQALSI